MALSDARGIAEPHTVETTEPVAMITHSSVG
jgi:hypothetical protein